MHKNSLIRFTPATIITLFLISFAGFTGNAYAQGGGGGHEPPDYGDLVFLYRDAYGLPILDANLCQQPIAFPSDICAMDCTGLDPCLVPVDPLTCAVVTEYEACTHEVEFGRINEVRAPPAVLERQLEDVVVKLATADCISLDPAGRLVTSVVDDTTLAVVTSAIDSPLQNLAIYRQLMMTGFLGDEASPIILPGGIMETAARGLGVAADKTGEVNVNLVAYLNQIMGLTDLDTPTVLSKTCIDIREEVMGNVELVEKCFLNYGDVPNRGAHHAYRMANNFEPLPVARSPLDMVAWPAANPGNGAQFAYGRIENFGALPAPAYIPADDPNTQQNECRDGWFEHIAYVPGTIDPYYFEIVHGPILEHVFGSPGGNVDPGFTGGNIGGFAQAADDTRAVINFMHSWATPIDFETPVQCTASGGIGYDLSISEQSGLQVPKEMVTPTEGREFSVRVDNAGPDAATGIVTVTAVTTAGGPVIDEDGNTSPFVFPFDDLAPGASASTTVLFTLGEPYESATITWTATIEAPFDVNGLNNSVTRITDVRAISTAISLP